MEKITDFNLKNMRQFYVTFQKSYALRSQLSWTHYCSVRNKMLVEKELEIQQRAVRYAIWQGRHIKVIHFITTDFSFRFAQFEIYCSEVNIFNTFALRRIE